MSDNEVAAGLSNFAKGLGHVLDAIVVLESVLPMSDKDRSTLAAAIAGGRAFVAGAQEVAAHAQTTGDLSVLAQWFAHHGNLPGTPESRAAQDEADQ